MTGDLVAYIWGFCVGTVAGAFLMLFGLALMDHLI